MLPAHKNIAINELTDPSSVFISILPQRKETVIGLNLLYYNWSCKENIIIEQKVLAVSLFTIF